MTVIIFVRVTRSRSNSHPEFIVFFSLSLRSIKQCGGVGTKVTGLKTEQKQNGDSKRNRTPSAGRVIFLLAKASSPDWGGGKSEHNYPDILYMAAQHLGRKMCKYIFLKIIIYDSHFLSIFSNVESLEVFLD